MCLHSAEHGYLPQPTQQMHYPPMPMSAAVPKTPAGIHLVPQQAACSMRLPEAPHERADGVAALPRHLQTRHARPRARGRRCAGAHNRWARLLAGGGLQLSFHVYGPV